MEYVFIAIVVLIAALLIANIKVVPQATVYIVEFFGKYRATWEAGLHLKIPFAERVARRITLKEQVLDSPPQPVITKDNVTMQIDTVVYYRVFDPKLFAYGVVNPVLALENLAATMLRNEIGNLILDDALTSRSTINERMAISLDEATDKWGIKVTRVEIKNIMPPREIQAAMEKQMKAERDKRATVLEAEAHKQSVITRAQGDKEAKVLEAQGEKEARITIAEGEARAVLLARQAEADGIKALVSAGISPEVLELKKYESLVDASNSQSAKLIIPTDITDLSVNSAIFSEVTELGAHTRPSKPQPKKKAADPCCDD